MITFLGELLIIVLWSVDIYMLPRVTSMGKYVAYQLWIVFPLLSIILEAITYLASSYLQM